MRKRILFLILFACLTSLFNICHSQDCSQVRKVPVMFIPKEDEDLTKHRFKKGYLFRRSKEKLLLKKNINQSFTEFYTRAAINELISAADTLTEDSIHIFFARYIPCKADPYFPGMNINKVILLFSPGKYQGLRVYYYLSGNYIHVVDQSCANTWIDDYEKNTLPILYRSVKKNDPENEVTTGVYSDTRSISYSKADFKDAFQAEPEYQKKNLQTTVTGFELNFTAYSKKGKAPSIHDQHHYRRRLFVLFDYTMDVNGVDQAFHLEDNHPDDFIKRRDCTGHAILKVFTGQKTFEQMSDKEKWEALGLNNGQLCPTYCPGR